MSLDDATGGGADDAMMTGHVTGDTAYYGALDTSLCAAHTR